MVAKDGDVLLPQRTWFDGPALRLSVLRRKMAEERRMGSPQEAAAQDLFLARARGFEFPFGRDVSQCNALPPCDVGLLGKVLLQRPVDVSRMRALPLDQVRVVRVHRAHQLSNLLPGRLVRGTLQTVGLFEDFAAAQSEPVQLLLRKQGFELMRLVVGAKDLGGG